MNTFVVEGRWAVEAVLDSPFQVLRAVLEVGRHSDLASRLQSENVAVQHLSKAELEAERGYAFHRGVFAEVRRPDPEAPSEDFLREAKRLAVPVGLADPGNLGTVIRSAVAFGADGVVVEQGKGADVYNAKCIRASATGVFQVPIFEIPSLKSELTKWQDAGFVIFGTSLSESSVTLYESQGAKRSAILLGSEEEGLSKAIETGCDELVRIPMKSGMDSLNVAGSAAITFWELWGKGR